MREWLRIAWRRDVRRRALRVALVVGTVLALINHFDRLLSGTLDTEAWIKIALTYLVPYAVSTHAAVGAIRAQQKMPAK
jgi:hypothetical protein